MAARLTDQERAFRDISEKQYQKQITDLATMYGWRFVHFGDSRNTNKHGQQFGDRNAAGFPDLTLTHPRFGLGFIEVKRELGKVKPNQAEWLDALLLAGVPAFVSRPSGWDFVQQYLTQGFSGVLDSLHAVR